jgi:hypothetical protein
MAGWTDGVVGFCKPDQKPAISNNRTRSRIATTGFGRTLMRRTSQALEGNYDLTEEKKPRLIGINHVAIEVGNIDEALEWYGRIFDFALRGMGLALAKNDKASKEFADKGMAEWVRWS